MDDKRRKRKHEAGKSGRVCLELKLYVSEPWVKNVRVLDLLTLEEGIKDKAGIGKQVIWERMLLLYAARIRLVSLAHSRIADIIIGAIWRAVGIFVSKERRRGMG